MRFYVLWLTLAFYFDVNPNQGGKVDCHSDALSATVTTPVVSEQRNDSTTSAAIASVLVEPTTTTSAPLKKTQFLDAAKDFIAKSMASSGGGFARKLLQADISSECSIGILKFMRAVKDLEPWALRLLDSSAKIPIGVFQGTILELGAFDECIETVVHNDDGTERVRAQYCNLYVKSGGDFSLIDDLMPAFTMFHKRVSNFTGYLADERLPGFRLGICVINDCAERDLQELLNTFVGGVAKVTIRNCVTNQPEDINTTQIWILAVLATIAAAVIAGTAFDVFVPSKIRERCDCLVKCVTAFSMVKNTKYIFGLNGGKTSDAYNTYGFVNGLRFFSMFWIILGHTYGYGLESSSRVFNVMHYFQHWHTVIVTFGYQAVDTFFFFSGFFLYFKLDKENGNRIIVSIIAILRWFIRVTIPTFFMIMCMYLLPLVASGPNSKEYYNTFYEEIRDHWWDLLLQVRNWRDDFVIPILHHVWYISANFQLFIAGVLVIQSFKTKKWLVCWIFGALSLASCAISAWQIYGTDIPPFLIALNTSYRKFLETVNKYYSLPFYHGVCFFSGCVTFLAVQKYGARRLPGVLQAIFWCTALFCGLFCLFVKHLWYRSDGRASEPTRMAYAFIDRILWSVCVSWFVFACATCKAGPLSRLLSWEGMIPLGRLSFGVYLLHVPIQTLSYNIARERRFYSHYTLVSSCFAVLIWSYILSYLMFVACEGPTANLEALLFRRRRPERSDCKGSNMNGNRAEDGKMQMCFENEVAYSPTLDSTSVAKGYRL
nr:nose resistant to fluoxetine protein 6-like [Rhipicephalus microplus]